MKVKLVRNRTAGFNGWIAVGVIAVVADLYDEKTMSLVCRETVRNPVAGPVLVGGWAYLSAHLLGLLPAKYDLFKLLGKRIVIR
jgi:hypothetical protein